jgi:DNA-binding NtrC family response regulator
MMTTADDRRTKSGSASTESRRVLVVDDEPGILDGLTMAFTRAGQDVVGCRSFEDARAALLADDFHCLITDVRLGAFNGLQLAVIARHRHPGMRIIVFSGFDDAVLRDEAARLDATFVAKPFTASQLLEIVNEC